MPLDLESFPAFAHMPYRGDGTGLFSLLCFLLDFIQTGPTEPHLQMASMNHEDLLMILVRAEIATTRLIL